MFLRSTLVPQRSQAPLNTSSLARPVLIYGTPVDRGGGFIRQALLVELEEDPLRPAVVSRVRRVDFPVPVVGEAQRLDLPPEVVDVFLGDLRRVRARRDGEVLGGQSERVPAHRVQDVEVLHALVAAQDVGGGVALGVAHVEPAADG